MIRMRDMNRTVIMVVLICLLVVSTSEKPGQCRGYRHRHASHRRYGHRAPAFSQQLPIGDDDFGGTDGDDGAGTDGDGTTTDGDGTGGDGATTDGDGATTDGDGTTTDGDGATTDGDGATTDGDGDGTDDGAATNADYCALDMGHTMCIYPGPSDACASMTIYRELTDDAKNDLLNMHNSLRSSVALCDEPSQPPAANMVELVWDDELALIAQRLADQCIFAHDSVRNLLDGTSSGQNLAIQTASVMKTEAQVLSTISDFVQSWYDEVTSPGFNPVNIAPFSFDPATGHYTQLAWAETTRVGCGYVYFLEAGQFKRMLVCNYAPAGNVVGSTMYIIGTACSQCPTGTACDSFSGLCVVL